jgi:hypothetical protein
MSKNPLEQSQLETWRKYARAADEGAPGARLDTPLLAKPTDCAKDLGFIALYAWQKLRPVHWIDVFSKSYEKKLKEGALKITTAVALYESLREKHPDGGKELMEFYTEHFGDIKSRQTLNRYITAALAEDLISHTKHECGNRSKRTLCIKPDQQEEYYKAEKRLQGETVLIARKMATSRDLRAEMKERDRQVQEKSQRSAARVGTASRLHRSGDGLAQFMGQKPTAQAEK